MRLLSIHTQEISLERFLSFQVGQAGDKLSSSALCNSLEINLLAPANGHGSGLDKVLEAEVVDTASGQDHVGAGAEDLLDALLGDVGFTIADPLELLGIGDQNLGTR